METSANAKSNGVSEAAAREGGQLLPTSNEATDATEGTSAGELVVAYLDTERGHQLANRFLDLVDSLKKATLDERAQGKALEGELARLNLRQTWWLRTLGILAVVGSTTGLAAQGTLSGEAAVGILAAVAGYLFAQPSGRRTAG